MASLNKSNFLRAFSSYLPIIILFISVFNEFDFNYLKIENFSFNFVYILVFYWTLISPDSLGYFSIFLAGIVNDVVIGIPIGISSLCYLIMCAVTAYIRNIKSNIITCIELIRIIVNKKENQSFTKFGLNVIFLMYAVTAHSIK